MDDCLRCHGMHFEGGIRDLVAPVDTKGPWRLLRPELAGPAGDPVPELPPGASRGRDAAQGGAAERRRRREIVGEAGAVAALGQPVRPAGTAGTSRWICCRCPRCGTARAHVKISPDPRQALCYQCHAPLAGGLVGSGDDRTPVGVHEGLSCLACHLKHGQQTRASCANCHPRLSNCGLDVEKMDTTFLSTASGHNIHSVKCADCHPQGDSPQAQLIGSDTHFAVELEYHANFSERKTSVSNRIYRPRHHGQAHVEEPHEGRPSGSGLRCRARSGRRHCGGWRRARRNRAATWPPARKW